MEAAYDGKQNSFDKLLKYPQDISIVDHVGENVFHYVICYRNDEWLDKLKKQVNDAKKLKELLNREANDGWTPLHWAARLNRHQSIKWLLLNGDDVNATTNYGDLADDVSDDAETIILIREHRDKW